jgi:hypothetical protein
MNVITHRGLDPSKISFFPESTWEAFGDQLLRGYGLEFDFQPTRDGELVVFHSPNLSAISGGARNDKLADLTAAEIKELRFEGCRLCFLEELIAKIKTSKAPLCALHFKGQYQTDEILKILTKKLYGFDPKRFIIFDVKIDTAKKLKAINPLWQLAPSVAHPYDIARYNNAVHGTLLSVAEALNYKELFYMLWLDEWDRRDANGRDKIFYSSDIFVYCREVGFKIGLVTPELHATSPGLLAAEKHPDAVNKLTLFKRIGEIIALKPDLICTDYPDEVSDM